MMQVTPSGYWRYAAQQRNQAFRCARVQPDVVLSVEIERVWQENLQVYGATKCGANCAVRGSMWLAAQWSADAQGRPAGCHARQGHPHDHCRRKGAVPTRPGQPSIKAQWPNQLWVSDFTYVLTWHGFVYVALVIDIFARHVVDWHVSSS